MKNRLRELREEKGLSQNELGKMLNVNQRAISHYENGKRDMGTDTLNKLANFFDVSVDYLLGRTNERKKLNISEKPADKWTLIIEKAKGHNISPEKLEKLVDFLIENK